MSQRRRCQAEILKARSFYLWSDLSKNRAGPRTKTILHIVLKFQVHRMCFQRGEASANLGGKV